MQILFCTLRATVESLINTKVLITGGEIPARMSHFVNYYYHINRHQKEIPYVRLAHQ